MSLIPVGNTQWYGPHMLAKTPGPYLAMRILPYNTVIKTWQMFSLSSLLRAIFRCKSSQPHYVSCKLYCCKLSCQSFIPFWLFFWNLPSFTCLTASSQTSLVLHNTCDQTLGQKCASYQTPHRVQTLRPTSQPEPLPWRTKPCCVYCNAKRDWSQWVHIHVNDPTVTYRTICPNIHVCLLQHSLFWDPRECLPG